MSDDEHKSVKEQPPLSGKKDPSTDPDEESMEAEEESMEVEDECIEEEEGASTDIEGESLEEDNASTLNGNPSLEEDSTPIGEEASSAEEGCTVKESPTVEEKHTTVLKEDPTVEVEDSTIEKEDTAVEMEHSAIEKEDPTVEVEDLPIEKEDTAVGMEHSAIEKEDPTVEEGRSVIEKEPPSMEVERATTDKESPCVEEPAPAEKECQTVEQEIAYKEITTTEAGHEPVDKEAKEVPSAEQDQGFFDKGCQTTSVADDKPEPIDREIQTTLRVERSLSSSSLDASMGGDSGNSLKECPSIEEEPPPEPIEGELLQVRAQVMVRNDSTGGWVPEGCGGMSTVTIIKIETPRKPGDETPVVNKYMIRGKRLSDQKVTLTCTIVKDFEYNKVMPTFHHWKSGDEKFGLTFQTTTEARIFDKGLRDTVYAYLLELDPNAVPLKIEGEDDDDFLAFTKPAEPRPRTPSPEVVYELPDYLLPNAEEEERIQFMQLTSLPEYFYKDYRTDNHKADNKLRRRPLHRTRKPLKYFGLIRRTTRLRCKYCHELYEEEENTKGQCRYAPDCVKSVIDELTCMRCAKLFMHDCMMDPDEDYSHPCTCRDDGYCGLRWAGLCLLSLIVPCILFYPPMKGCYDCGVHCGVCGGRHEEKIIRRVEHII